MPPFVAYHGVTAAEHQARVNDLAPRRYRPTSLSVSGASDDAPYAAVWIERPGPAWVAVHGFTAAQYQTGFDELTSQGYAPDLVTATGDGNNSVFATVFQMGVTRSVFARHGLRWDPAAGAGSVNFENQRAFDQGYLPGAWRCTERPAVPSSPVSG